MIDISFLNLKQSSLVSATWKWSYLLQRRCRRGLIELGLPLAKHLMNLLLKHCSINSAALLPSKLQIQEHHLQVIHTVLRLVLKEPVRCRVPAVLGNLLHCQTWSSPTKPYTHQYHKLSYSPSQKWNLQKDREKTPKNEHNYQKHIPASLNIDPNNQIIKSQKEINPKSQKTKTN